MPTAEFLIPAKSGQPTAFSVLTNDNFVLLVVQARNFEAVLDSPFSFFGTLVLRHVGMFLKK